MRTSYVVALSMVGGIGVGGLAIQTLHAQSKPPVYMIAINEVSNPDGYKKEYLPPAQKSIKDHGGVYVAAGAGTVIAGNPPNGRVVILRWESIEALKKWRNSTEYQAALKKGEQYAKYNILVVDGVKQ
jgi:uncharacterized protein (DUF1330 family)